MAAILTRLVLLCVLLLPFFGCAPLKPYDGIIRPPKDQIDVYEDGRGPEKPYKVIMSFSETGNIGDEAHAHRSFVEQAKKLGADGIIFKPSVMGHAWGLTGGKSEGSFSAVAIVYQNSKAAQ